MIPEIQELNLPRYATLSDATVTLNEMGDRTITASVKIDSDEFVEFIGTDGNDWALRFRGEKFIMPLRKPQGVKDNSSVNHRYDLTFYSWITYQLKRYYFVELSSVGAGTAIADKYKASLGLNAVDFIDALDKVLVHYFGGKIRARLHTEDISPEPMLLEINYTYIWDVLSSVFESYALRYQFVYDPATDSYEIAFGMEAEDITHTFEYGYNGGLLKIERTVQSSEIKNLLLGRGGSKNLPLYYFKKNPYEGEDTDRGMFRSDPDACPELANVYFDTLRDKNFRDYIIGWNHVHHGGPSWEEHPYTSGNPTWAYDKGCTDEKFSPIEYVKDDESIEKYGEIWGALDDNEEIYPSIQGVWIDPYGRIDEVVAVEEIVTDDTEAKAKADAVVVDVEGCQKADYIMPLETKVFNIVGNSFSVPEGKVANLPFGVGNCFCRIPTNTSTYGFNQNFMVVKAAAIHVFDKDKNEVSNVGLQAGEYTYTVDITAYNGHSSYYAGPFTVGAQGLKLTYASAVEEGWKPTFDIWVKNIWQTHKGQKETNDEYVQRVWGPILGDREGAEAAVTFSDGMLSGKSDWEFVIRGSIFEGVHYDNSKEIDGVRSEWRLTLIKSEAEMDAIGKYIPYVGVNAKAGDHFYFTGIDMNHFYTLWAESKLNTNKIDNLHEISDTNPTWAITFDKVKIQENNSELYKQFGAGKLVTISNPQLTGGDRLKLYITAVTYRWDNGAIIPNVEVTLSEKVVGLANRMSTLENQVNVLSRSYATLSSVSEQVMSLCSTVFLKKDGVDQTSLSPTKFASYAASENFKQGGFGGSGWGLYQGLNGDSILEVDNLIVRERMQVNQLTINQVEAVGGIQVMSAAALKIEKVFDEADGYHCYFSQNRGEIGNLFKVDDVAFCQSWGAQNDTQKFYKRRVTEVGDDYIVLSKTDVNGTGIPQAGDNVVQYGNYTNADRQFAVVTSAIGGGYQRMICGLDSVDAVGREYFYAGKQATGGERLFIGNNSEYLEYKDNKLVINAVVHLQAGSDGLKSLKDFTDLSDEVSGLEYLKAATNDGSTTVGGGLILTNLIQLGYKENDVFHVESGISGFYDKTVKGNGIAAWYGGPMADWETAPQGAKKTDYAASLFRMDGTGYLAGGNISWDDRGYGQVGNGLIRWDENGLTLSDDVKLGDKEQTVAAILEVLNLFEWDTDNIWVKGKRNFYTKEGNIAAGGIGKGGGGGGGGTVTGVKVNGTLYGPNDDGNVEIPDYPIAMTTARFNEIINLL